ncbi:hypothetical protein BSKO_01393 [Bryopsis sp. KO-2023]|nr:hypothetical protein BSKO_01393 [Bryopsis sp. KO-2023]
MAELPSTTQQPRRSNRPSLGQKQTNNQVEQVLNNGEHPSICGEALIGMRVSKKFGRKMYNGVVRSFDPLVAWYGVKYEDSDEEEVDFVELQDILVEPGVLRNKEQAPPSKKRGKSRKRRKSPERSRKSAKQAENIGMKLEEITSKRVDLGGVDGQKMEGLIVQGDVKLIGPKPLGMTPMFARAASESHTSKSSGEKNNEGTPCGGEGEKEFNMGCDVAVVPPCKILSLIEGVPGCDKAAERRRRSVVYKEHYRRERMKPLEWPDFRPASGEASSESCPIDRVQRVWNLSDECVSLLQDLAGSIHVDESLHETDVNKVKECQRAYYEEWVKHDEIEREKIKQNGRSVGSYGRIGINNAIRIAERAMEGRKINTDVNIGHVPGVPVNLQIQARGELNCLGLHRPNNRAACVDIVEYSPEVGEPVPLALSVVVSRSKKVRPDEVDEMIFLGEGGEDVVKGEGGRTRIRKHRTDQGLVNCHRFGLPIRLIRQVSARGYVLKYRYTYEGLWWVSEAWPDTPGSMKFRLVRMSKGGPGEGKVLLRPRERILCEDISFGQEPIKIPVVNGVDDAMPPGLDLKLINGIDGSSPQHRCDYSFHYTKGYVYSDPSVHYPAIPTMEKNENPHAMIERLNMCAPYTLQRGSKVPLLNQRRSILYECGPWCHCKHGVDCSYAVTERGIRFKLQVFRTKQKGWGVRTLEYIPAGAFVTTYAGVIVPHGHAEVIAGRSEYVFDMCRRTDMSNDNRYLDRHRSDIKIKYAVDAKNRGNVARFINHSCDPNTFVQPTLSTHLDESMPKICLFASKHIFPGEELNYDYGDQFVMECLGGKCHCGSSNCITAQSSDVDSGVDSDGVDGGGSTSSESRGFGKNKVYGFDDSEIEDIRGNSQWRKKPIIGPEMAKYLNGWSNGQFSHASDLKVRIGAVPVINGSDDGSSEYSDINIM